MASGTVDFSFFKLHAIFNSKPGKQYNFFLNLQNFTLLLNYRAGKHFRKLVHSLYFIDKKTFLSIGGTESFKHLCKATKGVGSTLKLISPNSLDMIPHFGYFCCIPASICKVKGLSLPHRSNS